MHKANSVKGKNSNKKVLLYTLSTCVWCKKTKRLLEGLGAAYDYIDVDLLSGAEEEAVMEEVRRHNPACTFPTVVIDGKHVIAGFREDEIRKALG